MGYDLLVGVDEDEIGDVPDAPLLNEGTVEGLVVAEAVVVDTIFALDAGKGLGVGIEAIADGIDGDVALLHLAAETAGAIEDALRAALPAGPEDYKEVVATEIAGGDGLTLGRAFEGGGAGAQAEMRQGVAIAQDAIGLDLTRELAELEVVGVGTAEAVVNLRYLLAGHAVGLQKVGREEIAADGQTGILEDILAGYLQDGIGMEVGNILAKPGIDFVIIGPFDLYAIKVLGIARDLQLIARTGKKGELCVVGVHEAEDGLAVDAGGVLELAFLNLYGVEPVDGSAGAVDIELALLEISKISCNPNGVGVRITGDKC